MIDHKAQAQSRIYAQYRNKSKLMQWIAINGDLGNEIEGAYTDVLNSYDIDTAGTDELDVLGRIVGIGRSFESVGVAFSYLWGAAQFGAAQFRPGAGTTDQTLNNDIYRLLIKAKIAKNTNDATLDGIINAIDFIIETQNIRIEDNEDMSFRLVFDTLTDLEVTVLTSYDIVPKPQGVKYIGFVNLEVVTEFGAAQFGRSQFTYDYKV